MDGVIGVIAAHGALLGGKVYIEVAGEVVIKHDIRGRALGIRGINKSVGRGAALALYISELGENEHRAVLRGGGRARERVSHKASLAGADDLVLRAGYYVFGEVCRVHGVTVAGYLEGHGGIGGIVGLSGELGGEVILGAEHRLYSRLVLRRAHGHAGVRIVGVLRHSVKEAPVEVPIVSVVFDVVGYELQLPGEEDYDHSDGVADACLEGGDVGGIVHEVSAYNLSFGQAWIVVLVILAEHELRADARVDEEL